jgi:hypothetical protein
MFHFPGFPPPTLYIQAGVTPHHGCRVPPFGHPRINARLTAPRGLSRPPTSFIGSWYQGIHHAPLITYTHTRPRQHTGTHDVRNTLGKQQNQSTTTPTSTRPRPTGRNSLAGMMLASTIQFTNTHPRPATRPPDIPPPAETARRRTLREQWRPGTEKTNPHGVCSLRTQQCVDPHPPATAPRHMGRGGGRRGNRNGLRCSTSERARAPHAFGGMGDYDACSLERR